MSLRPILLTLSALATLLLAAPAAAQAATFSDIDGNAHAASIEALSAEDIVFGCTDDRFCPDRRLTRAQMASLLERALELPAAPDQQPSRFTDIDGNTHEHAIRALEEAELVQGCTDGQFCPDDRITRGQLATIFAEALSLDPAPSGTYFADAGGTHQDGIDALAHNGVAAGCDLIHFCTGSALSRAQAATFLARGVDFVDRVELASYQEREAEYEEQRRLEAERREQERREAEQREQERLEAEAAAPGEKAAQVALDQVGKPYQWGGNGPSSFDCSGLTSYAWRAAGVEIPRTSRDQYAAATSISRSQLRAGDLIFYHSPVSHVAMYVGDGKVVEAPYSGKQVRVSDTGLSRSGIVGYGRFS